MASSSPWVVAVVAAVVGGLAGGGATHLLSSSEAKTKPKAEKRRSSDSDSSEGRDDGDDVGAGTSSNDKRLNRLEKEIAALKRKSAAADALRKYASTLAAKGGDGSAADPNKLNPVADAEDPVFSLAVRSVMDQIEWEKNEERKVTRAARRTERVRRQTDQLAKDLGLSASQVTKVEAVLKAQSEAFQKLRSADPKDRPVTRREWRTKVGEIRKETRTAMQDVLDEEQLKKYDELEDDSGPGRRGGGRRGRGR